MVLWERGTSGWIEGNARRLRTLYYAAFGLVFVVTWIAPTFLGPRVLRTLVFYLILETMAIFTSFALLMRWLEPGEDDDPGRAWLPLIWVPLGTAIAFMLAHEFGILWGMAPFVLSLASMAGELMGAEQGGERVQPAKHRLVATFLIFTIAGVSVMLLPTPALGITDAVIQQQGFEGMAVTSDFFDAPEMAMAWGSLYFLGLAAAQRYRFTEHLARWDTSGEPSS